MARPQEAFTDITKYMNDGGGAPSAWYAGVATDPRQRLFNDHNVNEARDRWIFRTCNTDEEARRVEDALIRMGCKGGAGGGDASTRAVYLYRIAPHTRE